MSSTSRLSLLQLVSSVLRAYEGMLYHNQQLQEEAAALRSCGLSPVRVRVRVRVLVVIA